MVRLATESIRRELAAKSNKSAPTPNPIGHTFTLEDVTPGGLIAETVEFKPMGETVIVTTKKLYGSRQARTVSLAAGRRLWCELKRQGYRRW